MTEVRWGAYDTIVSYLTTELNALADGAAVLGAAIDFTAAGVDRKQYMDIEINLASADWSLATAPVINVWLLACTDGTNYEDGDAAVTPGRVPDGVGYMRIVSGAQRIFIKTMLTTPYKGKLLIKNNSDVALAATGNTVKYYTYGDEAV